MFRVLNVSARALVAAISALDRPVVLRNAGACDLVSLRGIMHAVQYARLTDVRGQLLLCDWGARPKHASQLFADTRSQQLRVLVSRMRARMIEGGSLATVETTASALTLEGSYLAAAVDPSGSVANRLAGALLAIRACFFSTNYEGALLAAETGLALLDTVDRVDESDLGVAWDQLDDPRFDIPMLELDRSSLGGRDHLKALLLLHVGIVRVFSGRAQEGRDVFGRALEESISPAMASDLRLYRALVSTKVLGDTHGARIEIALGLGALAGQPHDTVATHAAWLHNLDALTYLRQKDLAGAQRAEERALSCIDHAPGPSATHLKTNLISNFSVLYEAKGDLPMATKIWQSFAALNAKLGSSAADKVYLNRLGALYREAGAIEAALDAYRGAFEKAETTGDAFHAETIAGAIARVYRDREGWGDREHAEQWYGVAAARARACGDCVQLACGLAGAVIATRREDFSEAREALFRDVTYTGTGQANGIEAALQTNSAQIVRGALPPGKSKLSRPFTLVNL
jgi:tetratricopeptide (TPR) repeat protein